MTVMALRSPARASSLPSAEITGEESKAAVTPGFLTADDKG